MKEETNESTKSSNIVLQTYRRGVPKGPSPWLSEVAQGHPHEAREAALGSRLLSLMEEAQGRPHGAKEAAVLGYPLVLWEGWPQGHPWGLFSLLLRQYCPIKI